MLNLGEQPAAKDLIKEGTDAGFMADVVEASKTQPVIVDFWAPWCGPCRQLGPSLERAVNAEKGKVKLVKIDIDKHPVYAGQLRVQSIPAVFAFKDGRPVDAFMGAVPESQVKAFIAKLVGSAPALDGGLDEVIAAAQDALASGDVGGAAEAFAAVLQHEPTNLKAIAGLARCYLAGGDADRASAMLRTAPPDAKDPELDAVRTAIRLAEGAPSDLAALESRVAADPDDFVGRVELARGEAARGRYAEAAEQLFAVVEKDRDWNGGQARRVLLDVFEAAGPNSEIARGGRRRLSSILFS